MPVHFPTRTFLMNRANGIANFFTIQQNGHFADITLTNVKKRYAGDIDGRGIALTSLHNCRSRSILLSYFITAFHFLAISQSICYRDIEALMEVITIDILCFGV